MQSQVDDVELMRRIGSQDEQALRALYRQYGKAIYSLAYRILQNGTLAEEVTQDTLLKIWRQKNQWDPLKGTLKNWLLTIAQFTAIDRLRQERRQPNLYQEPIEDVEHVLPAIESGWQEGVVLRLLVGQLLPEQAYLIDLAFFRGMTHSEIAELLKLPLGTVKTRLRTALQRLRVLWLESIEQKSTGH